MKMKTIRQQLFNSLGLGLVLCLPQLGSGAEPTEMDVRTLYSARDTNGDGAVSCDEYVAPFIGGQFEAAARAEAAQYDFNGDGSLSLLEFALTPQPPETRSILFELLDSNTDKQLSWSEYQERFPTQQRPQQFAEFCQRDLDANRQLTKEEFDLPADQLIRTLKSEFATHDTDQDGHVTRDEYIAPVRGGKWEAAATTEAEQYDWNNDHELSPVEFLFSPRGSLHLASAIEILDEDTNAELSLQELIGKLPANDQRGWAGTFHRRDADGNGRLTVNELQPEMLVPLQPCKVRLDRLLELVQESEAVANAEGAFPLERWHEIAAQLPEFSVVPVTDWDQDSSGDVSREEIVRVGSAALGMSDLEGRSLIYSNGTVVNSATITAVDADHDSQISLAEYLKFLSADPQATDRFAGFDANHNEVLDAQEIIDSRILITDPFVEFSIFDGNFDGYLTQDELVVGAAPWQTRMAPRLPAAFDDNGDKKLDLREFLSSPYANLAIEWFYGFSDQDNDGLLSWSEFRKGTTVQSIALQKLIFDRFDLNDDQFLSGPEFDFSVDSYNIPVELAFDRLDENHDGKLDADDVAGGEDRRARAEILLARIDQNSNQVIDLAEFTAKRIQIVAAWTESQPPPSLEVEYLKWDTDADGLVSASEYFLPFRGSQFQQAAIDESKLFDGDGNGSLSLLEFALSPRGDAFPADVYRLLDTNSDGHVTLREYVLPCSEAFRLGRKIRFHRSDINGDGRLSQEEHSVRENLAPPDPVLALCDALIEKARTEFEQLDTDGDGLLTKSESAGLIESLNLTPFASLAVCDLDHNGQLGLQEVVSTIRSGFGVETTDGHQLRRANGMLVDWATWSILDQDRNGKVSRIEFLRIFNTDPNAENRFASGDTNSDGNLDLDEICQGSLLFADPFHPFSQFDKDLDGQLSQQELESAQGMDHTGMRYRLLKAYDVDLSGSLSLQEFRLTPFANPVIEWYHTLQDSNNDGVLSWDELHRQKTLQYALLLHDTMDRFDLDHDGQLSTGEFEFNVQFDQVPAAAAFGVLDRNLDHRLTKEDAVGLVRPAADDAVMMLQWEERSMQVEEALSTADANADGFVSAAEFEPHRTVLATALTGQVATQPRRVTKTIVPTTTGESAEWSARSILLITLNILGLCGLGWWLIRKP